MTTIQPGRLYARFLWVPVVMALGLNAPSAYATCTGSVWNLGASGNWNVAGDWSPSGVPNSSSTSVCIVDGTSTVSLTNLSPTIDDLTLATGNGLDISTGQTLNIAGTSISNAGTITLNGGGGANGIIDIGSSNLTLSGGGTLTLATTTSGGANAIIQLSGAGLTLTNANNTIQGNGVIGNNGLALVNQAGGVIDATTAGGQIGTLSLNGGGAITNQGLMEATSGTLVISNAVTNTGGNITANGGTVLLANGSSVTGGTLNTTGGGTMETASGNATLNGVTISAGSTYTATDNSTTHLQGTITNNGTILLNGGGGSNGIIDIDNAVTLSGGGTVTLATTASGGANAIIQENTSGLTLTNANNTIQGNGVIGNNGLALVNQAGGVINATTAGGQLGTLSLNGGGAITNQGLMEATSGTLVISNAVTNTGGNITANGGTVLLANGSSVTAGTLTNSGGTLETASGNGTTLDGSSVAGAVTINGTYTATDSSTTTLLGTINNKGTIQLNGGSGANGIIDIGSSNLTLSGGGIVTLATTTSGGANAIIQQGTSGLTLTNANNTIQGNGLIGNNGLAVVNQSAGTIDANVSGETLSLNGGGTITNAGQIEATGGGILQISNAVANAGGTITAGTGSTVQLINGSSVTAGTLTNSGGTLETASGNGTTLDGSSVAGAVTINGTYTATDSSTTTLLGTINNKGTIQLNGGSGANGIIDIGSSNLTLSGGGTLTLATTALNGANAIIQLSGAGLTLTNANNTIQGNGVIGNNGLALVNQSGGVIDATTAGGQIGTLSLNGGGAITNQGLMEATSGTLVISNAVTNTGGNITANGGTVLLANGSSVTGGTLNTTGGGTMETASGNATLNGVTISAGSTYTATDNSTTHLQGTITNNGTILLNGGGGSNGIIDIDNAVTLSGGGTVTLATTASGGANAIIQENTSGLTLTNANNTIQGNGVIGNNGLALVNQAGGVINATTAGGQLGTLSLNGGGAITNQGLMEATTGTLLVQSALTGTGTLQVGPAGTVNLANSPNAQGQLVMGAAGATLNIGTQNLTIGSDYNNAAWGTGNSFNSRTGISGAGLVVAGGNAAQAITGADVTNGGTTSATLTIGNVHVGANNYAYQIANTGTSGPTLRGAIQNSVNGASITDSRLSGSGVTASNYNTGGPGSNTGDLDVVFTAASAGALTALSGQSVNLASNFANIPNQKLNIVLGSGAAAYNLASGSTTPAPVTIGNQRVGGTMSQVLTVGNNAPSGSFTEVLNAGFGSNTGAATNNGGSISGGLGAGGVAAGGSNATAMSVGVNTATAGAQTGTVTLNYVSNGTGTSGLGTTSVGSQTITVSGNVYQVAAGAINTAPLNFGVVQVGQTVSQTLSVQNVATGAAGFVEDLNASFGSTSGTGASLISGTGSVSGLTAGNTDASHMTVTVNTASAGTVSGAIGVNFFTAGTVNGVSDNLGVAAVGSASYGVSGTIQTTGTVINDADPVIISPSPISLGPAHVGASSPVGFVSLTNQATSAPQASLNASITGNAPITASGTVTDLGPGGLDNTHLQVGMNTSAAGAISGTATLGLVSDAGPAGCTSNCLLTLASQNVAVTGGVYQYAQPSVASSVSLGNVRVGGTATGTIGVTNTNISPAGFQEGLDAGYVASSGTNGASASGAITNLAAGSGGTLNAALTAGAAGVQSGTVTIGLTSNGTIDGLSSTTLASQNVTVQATGYREANPLLAPSLITLNARVGDAAPSAALTVTNSSPDQYTEGLAGNLGAATGPFTNNGGAITNLAAQGVDGSTLKVGMSTATSGTFTGTQTVSFTSNGLIDNASAASVGTGTVNLAGNVYTTAVANVATPTVNFGIVHVGDTVGAQALTVSNAAAGALNDVLTGGFASVTGPFTGTGTLTGLAAGAPADSSTLQVGLNTATAGTFSGTATLGLLSHDGALSDVAAVNGGATVGLSAQVNYHATPTFELTGSGNTGGLTGSGDAFTLNLGTLTAGESITDLIEFLNGAPGQADALGGSFADAGSAPGLTLSGFDMVSGLLDGQGETGDAAMDTTGLTAGSTFTDVLTFSGTGSNASGFSEDLTATLTITGEIGTTTTNVPEPDPLALILIGGGGLLTLLGVRRRRAVTPSARTAALS